jgi:hypothetical protein
VTSYLLASVLTHKATWSLFLACNAKYVYFSHSKGKRVFRFSREKNVHVEHPHIQLEKLESCSFLNKNEAMKVRESILSSGRKLLNEL